MVCNTRVQAEDIVADAAFIFPYLTQGELQNKQHAMNHGIHVEMVRALALRDALLLLSCIGRVCIVEFVWALDGLSKPPRSRCQSLDTHPVCV